MPHKQKAKAEEKTRVAQECLASDKNYGETAKKYNASYQ